MHRIPKSKYCLGMTLLLTVFTAFIGAACGAAHTDAASGEPASITQRCVSRLELAPENHNTASKDALVPNDPRYALICRYFGTTTGSPHEPKLASHRFLGGRARVRSLAGLFGQLKPDEREQEPLECNAQTGAGVYVLFEYVEQPAVPVQVEFGGCHFVKNGMTGKLYNASAVLLARLHSLVPVPTKQP
jgi:hypothetical protein